VSARRANSNGHAAASARLRRRARRRGDAEATAARYVAASGVTGADTVSGRPTDQRRSTNIAIPASAHSAPEATNAMRKLGWSTAPMRAIRWPRPGPQPNASCMQLCTIANASVRRSTGFVQAPATRPSAPARLDPALEPLLDECLPYYEKLRKNKMVIPNVSG